MRFNILLVFFCNIFFGFSQDLDQIFDKYQSGDTDQKMTTLFAEYGNIESIDSDTILYFIRDIQSQGIKHNREDAIALSNYYFSHYLNDNGLFDEALNKIEDAISFYNYQDNDTMLAESYNAKGNSYYLLGEFGAAEYNYLKSYDFGKHSEEERFKSLSTANLARIYIYQEKYDKAKEILDKYIEYNKGISNLRNLGTGYGIYGQFYINQKEFDKAIEYLERSMEYNLSTGNAKLIANGYTNIAIASFIKDDLKRAEEYFQLALSYRLESRDEYFIAESYYNLGDYYSEVSELDSAVYFYNKSFETAYESDNKIGKADALEHLAMVYEKQEKYKLQANTLKEFIQLQKEINSEKMSKEIGILRASFQEDLKQKGYIGHKREEKLRSQMEEVSRVWDYWVWIVLIGLILFSGVVYFSLNKKKK